MPTIIGLETRLTSAGKHVAWRLVAYNKSLPQSRVQYLGGLPDDKYIRIPRDAIYGDLLRLGPTIKDQAKDIARDILRSANSVIHLAKHRCGMAEVVAMIAAGIDIRTYDVPVTGEMDLQDPLAIGGYAGHEIATIAQFMETPR